MFWRGKRDGWQGHGGFDAGRAKNGDILVLGGNQGDAVSIRPYSANQLLGYRWPGDVALPPDIEPLAKSGVVQGTSIAVASGGAIVVENLPALVTELERADRHIQAGTIFGRAIGVLIVAGGRYALWKRVRAARQLSEA
ncbi:C40 family peptidase [Acuticoccus sediminis]|uniref:hypothetical protein n=1 Tax=Acuticoccus sediminis TaxID=2184697 RepID=UPI001CFE7B80|nr:hypothetical protein [Acuticoccus sediminis]